MKPTREGAGREGDYVISLDTEAVQNVVATDVLPQVPAPGPEAGTSENPAPSSKNAYQMGFRSGYKVALGQVQKILERLALTHPKGGPANLALKQAVEDLGQFIKDH
jgi:hypothetical protein